MFLRFFLCLICDCKKKFSIYSEEQIKRWKKQMNTETAPHEVNLRKCCVLGGVLHLDLLERPPQPRDLRGKYVITVCKLKIFQPLCLLGIWLFQIYQLIFL